MVDKERSDLCVGLNFG